MTSFSPRFPSNVPRFPYCMIFAPSFLSSEATTEMSSRRLDEHVSSWTMDTIGQCLGYCRDWNTNARKAVVVHALVGSILRCVSIASLKELPVRRFFAWCMLCVCVRAWYDVCIVFVFCGVPGGKEEEEEANIKPTAVARPLLLRPQGAPRVLIDS